MTTITNKIDLIKSISNVSPYKTCIISTLQSNTYSSHIQKGELPLKLVYLNVLGPFRTGHNKARYIVTFLYDITQLSEVYYIKSKEEVFDCFRHFKA
jgi:hypothetical protein